MIDGNATGKSIKGKVTTIPLIDKTLTKESQCADAKATGDALAKKVNNTDIADNLTTADASKVLSANQGVELKKLIAAAENKAANALDNFETQNNSTIQSLNEQIETANGDIEGLDNTLKAAQEDIAGLGEDIAKIDGAGKVGTYAGDGSEAERRIATGFSGNALLVVGGSFISIITAIGGVGFSTTSSLVPFNLNSNAAVYSNGELILKTNNACVNADGYEYTYIAL